MENVCAYCVCCMISVIFAHASLRLRNMKNKLENRIEGAGLKKSPMGLLLEALGQQEEKLQKIQIFLESKLKEWKEHMPHCSCTRTHKHTHTHTRMYNWTMQSIERDTFVAKTMMHCNISVRSFTIKCNIDSEECVWEKSNHQVCLISEIGYNLTSGCVLLHPKLVRALPLKLWCIYNATFHNTFKSGMFSECKLNVAEDANVTCITDKLLYFQVLI